MKKSSYLVIYCTLLLCTILSFSLNSCSKEDEPTKTEPLSLSTEKSQYAPYEIVTISSSEDLFTEKSFTAVINNIEITIGGEGYIAAFMLPDLNNGKYDLSFTLNQKNYIVPITIASLSNIQSADQYFNEIKSNLNQSITDLNTQITQLSQNSEDPNEFIKLQNDVTKYTNLLSEYTTSYNNLSELDKIEFAKSIAANKALIDASNNLTSALQSSTLSLRGGQTVDDYEAAVEASTSAFTSSAIELAEQIPLIVAGAIIAKTPTHPIINIGAVLGTGYLVANFILDANKTITAAITLTNTSIKPLDVISQSSQVVYYSGAETVSDIQAKYRSLINTDGNDGSIINTIVEKYNYFMNKYNGLVNDLPSFIRPSYVMTSLKNSFKQTTRSIYNEYVSITNISNSNVILEQLNQEDGSIKIKATNSASTDQTFTYDVNYTNSKFTSGLTKTVNGKVVSDCLFDDEDMVGYWIHAFYVEVDDCSNGTGGAYYEFRTDKSIWWLGVKHDGVFTPLEPSDYEYFNGTDGYGSWNLSCSGYLYVSYGIGWGGLLNPLGNETQCLPSNGGSNKLMKE